MIIYSIFITNKTPIIIQNKTTHYLQTSPNQEVKTGKRACCLSTSQTNEYKHPHSCRSICQCLSTQRVQDLALWSWQRLRISKRLPSQMIAPSLHNKRQVNIYSSLAFTGNIQLLSDCLQGAVGSHRASAGIKTTKLINSTPWCATMLSIMSKKDEKFQIKSNERPGCMGSILALWRRRVYS